MGRWAYTGVTRQREEVAGVVDAADEVEARVRLRAMQIRPLSIALAAERPGMKFRMPNLMGSPIKLKHMLIFTRQFSSLIDSGVPVVQCLDILYGQEKRGLLKSVLSRVKDDIESGSGLAEALSRHPTVFSELFVRMVEAGEVSGTLDGALRRLGKQIEKMGRLKSKVISAVSYPLFTLIISALVLIFMLVKVIPNVAKMYADGNAQLPELTQNVLKVSQWFQDNVYLIVGSIAVLVIGFPILYALPAFRKVWDPITLRLPLFGDLIVKSTVARFSRTMSSLVASGVPLLTAFDICRRIVTNLAMQDVILNASQAVQEGKSMAQGLAVRGIFPPMVIHMVNIGEMTGRLDDLLGKVADIYEDEVDDAVGAITGLLQPVMIVGIGGMIAFLLLAMYLPIFQLADKTMG